jgi:hypothetical protein
MPQRLRRDLISLALGKQKIARVTATNFNDIGLGTKAGNVFGQDNFSGRHGKNRLSCGAFTR